MSSTLGRIIPIPSQVLSVKYNSQNLQITLDSGATVSYIKQRKVADLNLTVHPNNQLALLADKQTRMASLGEVDFIAELEGTNVQLRLRALVMKNLQTECFGGTTFHVDNSIEANIKSGTISIHGKFLVRQHNSYPDISVFPPPCQEVSPSCLSVQCPQKIHPDSEPCNSPHQLEGHRNLSYHSETHRNLSHQLEGHRNLSHHSETHRNLSHQTESHRNLSHRTETHRNLSHQTEIPHRQSSLRAISLPNDSLVLPLDHLPIPLPSETIASHMSITPSFPAAIDNKSWAPQICEIINGKALYQNLSDQPLIARKFSHFRPHSVTVHELADLSRYDDSNLNHLKTTSADKSTKNSMTHPITDLGESISLININRSALSDEQIKRIDYIHRSFSKVFDNDLNKGYNHYAGRFFADFTFSNKPPPTRVFVPQFNKKCSDLQQAKCDELERQGVLVDPKMYDIPVYHVSPTWIQQKGRAKHKNLQECTLDEVRFITAFNSLNDCIRPKPSTACSATSIFLFLSRWRHHIFADLNNSYFQLPVKRSLWSYMGVMTPY